MELLWWVSVVTALITLALLVDALWELDAIKQLHHGYYGAVLAVQPWVWWLWPVGLWLLIDDAYQHRRQLRETYYESPIHRWYVKAYLFFAHRGDV